MPFHLFARSSEGSRTRRGLAVGAGLAVLSAGLTPLAASADVSSKILTYPYSQAWSDATAISGNDSWSGVTGVQGYLGQDITTSSTGADPQTFTTESALPADTDVMANQTNPTTNSTGGVAEFAIADPVVALQGSGTADAPYLAFHLDLTGKTGVTFAFNARDIDGAVDNAVQQIAVQYRVGASGPYTNLPAGYIADATTGPSLATLVTARSVPLPSGVDNQSSVFVRVITSNASGSDEWVGIDDVSITATSGNPAPTGPAVGEVGDKTFAANQAITPFTVAATGGASPYTWSATGLPAGLSINPSTGEVSGTPTAAGASSVTVTATDANNATGERTFTVTITPAQDTITPIAEIQGAGATTPLSGQTVTTQGVVTASYPTGGLNGFYIQTPGADTPDASDAIFVYGGASGFTTYPEVGASVEVTGQPTEFSGATQIAASQSGVVPVADLGTVTAKTVIPGTDCALPGTECLVGAALNDAREVAEGELFQPTAPWTATDVYDGSPFYQGTTNSSAMRGELGLAAHSDKPLVAPTEVIDAQQTALVADRTSYNNAHRIVLDDGATVTFSGANSNQAFPWLTQGHYVRVGASVTFPKPVVFTEGFNTWRILPQSRVVGASTGTVDFEQDRPAAPQNVGGDLRLATFNVLNFFPTTGEEFVASGLGTCTYFTDREGNRISNNSCNPNGPRGAANEVNLKRQRDKIVAAINTADADIVSLEELENSVKFNKNRDFAINELVKALNAAAGPGTWAAVPSPAAADLPPTSEQDVIRNGFIYQPANVRLVGASVVLSDQSSAGEAFDDAREPVAQAFKKVGTSDAEAFAVIVNHFKSKGSGTPDPFGQGNATDRRIAQAQSLVAFADQFKTLRNISRVFLAGDFNAYSKEDPIQVLEDAGYTALKSSSDPGEETYNFDGMVGSLDHVLANGPALADVNAVDVWDINGYESLYYEYARFNSNITNLYAPNPFRSSDHSPEIVGINTADPTTTEVQILATNDFHGRLLNNAGGAEAGAAVMSGAVKELRGNNPNTVFAAAGDLIGASTFESFIQNDKPTIDVLNEAGLEVSAAGNHEFDAGYADLVNRVMQPYDAETNPYGGAEWEYIAANVRRKSDHSHALPESWIKDFGDVEVGFVGGVTEDLPALVTPAGIAELEITSIVTEANATADRLRAAGADVVVLLVHEGAPTTSYASATDPNSAFGKIVHGVDGDVDAIVSGHTHLAYNHSVPVQQWIDEGRAVTERPVVSAGQYGSNLNRLVFTLDRTTGKVVAKTQSVLALKTGQVANYPVDLPTKAIVDAAVARANELGARRLGDVAGPFNRAKLANGTTENRGGESTAGNLVAEVQRWATRTPEAGAAQIAFMNPGGLRADMVGTGTGAYPRTLTYRQAAEVQPFANTLVNMKLSGAQIKTALEQQWQRDSAGNIPSRPFLRLGLSQGFTYTYDPSKAEGSRVTGMYLHGDAIDPSATYSVTVNSFLASGGDNFRVFAQGSQVRDTGKSDLQAMVDYMAAFADAQPLSVDFTQRSVGYDFPADAPESYLPGDTVRFALSSLAFSTTPDLKDTEVTVALAGTVLGRFPVDNTVGTAVFDEYGTAAVAVDVPAATAPGTHWLTITGTTTGTTARVPFQVAPPGPSSVTGTSAGWTYGEAGSVEVSVTPASATGEVTVLDGETVLGTASLSGGAATVTISGTALEPGTHTLMVRYGGDDRNASSSSTLEVAVAKIDTSLEATAAGMVYGQAGSVKVSVDPASSTGVVKLFDGERQIGTAAISDGVATVAVPGTSLRAGTYTLGVRYEGDDRHEASASTVTLVVTEAVSSTDATTTPREIKVKRGIATIAVRVTATGVTPTGTVTAYLGGRQLGSAVALSGGAATLKVGPFDTVGTRLIEVRYSGDPGAVAGSSDTVEVRVVRSN